MVTGNPYLYHLPGQVHGDIESTDVTVSGGPTLLPEAPLTGRKLILIENGSGNDIYLGGSDVTIHDGVPLANGESLSLPVGRAALYATNAVTASGVRILEIA
jgi:hypothetical protein